MKIPFRIGDILVYVFILLIIGGSFAGLYQMGRDSVTNQVKVEVDGVLWGIYDIPAGDEVKEIRIDAGDGKYNLMSISGEGVSVKEANCPDQICVKFGKILRPGQTIVCLPHKVVISITGNQEGEPPLDDISS
ncbi:MAG TPA: NusG domain II-containing protein [Clostridiales bacterium]|nr:NusG domain II-containing protein [Clostridiales bacterium]